MPIVVFETIEGSIWELPKPHHTSQEHYTKAQQAILGLCESIPDFVRQAKMSLLPDASPTPVSQVKVIPEWSSKMTLNRDDACINLMIGQSFAAHRDGLRDRMWELVVPRLSGVQGIPEPSVQLTISIMDWCGRIRSSDGTIGDY